MLARFRRGEQEGSPAENRRKLLESKLKTLEALPGEYPGPDCPVCRNRGAVPYIREDSIAFRDCACMPMRRAYRLLMLSGLDEAVMESRFTNFETPERWQEKLKSSAMAYALDPQGWLVLSGQSGAGKSHLCRAVVRERLLKLQAVAYLPWRKEIDWLKALDVPTAEREKKLEHYRTAPMLYIDDLFQSGGGEPTSRDVSIAFDILNSRYENKKPTVISTELLPGQLQRVSEAVAGRMMEMAAGRFHAIERDRSRNWRLRGVGKGNAKREA